MSVGGKVVQVYKISDNKVWVNTWDGDNYNYGDYCSVNEIIKIDLIKCEKCGGRGEVL